MNTLQNTKSLRAAGTGRSQRSHGQRSCSSPIPFQSTRAQPKGAACRPAPQPRIVVPQAVRSDAATESLDAATLQLISDITRSVEASVSAATAASAQQGEQVGLTGSSESIALRAKVVAAIQRLSKGLLERETEVRLLLLAALSSEHLLLLGPPGTAKSELSRRLSSLAGGLYFERLLTRFSVPEELFGPLSMKGLENDQYVRHTEGYLPTAEVAFIDEVFKANSAILNALLTLLNERLFDNGNQRLAAPLLCLVGASNELPESEELDALYDRFLLRRHVAQVPAPRLRELARLAAGRASSPEAAVAEEVATAAAAASTHAPLGIEDFRTTCDDAYAAVDVPEGVIDVLTSLRVHLQERCEPPVYVSDRRFMKAVQLLQVAAFADGRDSVCEYDCLLLEHVFGGRADDAHEVRSHVLDVLGSAPGLAQAELLLLGLFGRAVGLLGAGEDARAAAELAATRAEAATLASLLAAQHASLAGALSGGFPALRGSVWHSASASQAAAQALTPQTTENRKKAEELLREVHVVGECLSRGVSGGMLERMLPKRAKQYAKGVSARA